MGARLRGKSTLRGREHTAVEHMALLLMELLEFPIQVCEPRSMARGEGLAGRQLPQLLHGDTLSKEPGAEGGTLPQGQMEDLVENLLKVTRASRDVVSATV